MIPQSTLISYHTEAFVKTEVACTVDCWSIDLSQTDMSSQEMAFVLHCFTMTMHVYCLYIE